MLSSGVMFITSLNQPFFPPNLQSPSKVQTGPFTILAPQDQDISELYVVQERHVADFEAPKL